MDPPPLVQVAAFDESVFLSSCKSLSLPIYKLFNIEPFLKGEIDAVVNKIGCGDRNYDLGLFQANLYITLDELRTSTSPDDQASMERTRVYILRKIQEMLRDFSVIIGKGKAFQENETLKTFIKKHMEKAKGDFESLLTQFKEGQKDLIKPKMLEYFALKLSFLADLAENPNLVYGTVHQGYGIYNNLDNSTKDILKNLTNLLEEDFEKSFLHSSMENEDFWKRSSEWARRTFLKKGHDRFFHKTIPIYTANGLIGIHTIVYCMLKGYFPIAISPSPYPVHSNTFTNLRISTLDHDYQHFYDIIQKSSTPALMNSQVSFTTFYPPVLQALTTIYEKTMAQPHMDIRKKDLILLFSFLHEKPEFKKGPLFYAEFRDFLGKELDRRRYLLGRNDLYSQGYIQQVINLIIFESIGYVNLFKTIGINMDINAQSFDIPTDLQEAEWDEKVDANIKRLDNFIDLVTTNITLLWKDFINRYPEELKPINDLEPSLLDTRLLN